jgi:hypothetical protein
MSTVHFSCNKTGTAPDEPLGNLTSPLPKKSQHKKGIDMSDLTFKHAAALDTGQCCKLHDDEWFPQREQHLTISRNTAKITDDE